VDEFLFAKPLKLEMHAFAIITFGLVVTLTFDLCPRKSFSIMHTRVMNICALFHQNPPMN